MKAYLHFYLFRMYGPIPITDVNIPVSAPPEVVKVKRDPVDKVAQYISDLLDEAALDLPLAISNTVTEDGRLIRGAAYMLKAKVWATAASDLFNGNPDYKGYKNIDGEDLFSETKEQWKWEEAVNACKQAIDNLPEKTLYRYTDNPALSDATTYQMNLRYAITERYNDEIIWARITGTSASEQIQIRMMPPKIDNNFALYSYASSYISPTLSIVERFYTKNGVPLDEDKDWDYTDRYSVATAVNQGYNLQNGYQTAKLNMDRENRFYASLAFDGALVYLNKSKTDAGSYPIQAKFGQNQGPSGTAGQYITVTGYYVIKLTHPDFTHQGNTSYPAVIGGKWYPWPEFRLADLYLLYAEALNETGDPANAKTYINLVRERSGLKGVDEAWRDHAKDPTKPNSQDGLREIIHQEREIELAFEGQRMWDLRRWRKASDFQNKPVQGWNTGGNTVEEYYQVTNLFDMQFITPRDYLWPLSISVLQRNPNLKQNPGW
jgi:hypothetical protein